MARNARLKSAGGNIVFVLTIFIFFLLVFEGQLVIPVWLQPVGRLHPLILHFPIVVILIAMGLEFFRFGSANGKKNDSYADVARRLLLAGVILTGLTVIMGIFLAQEPEYNAESLISHKWTGVALYFLSAIIYRCRSYTWYNPPVAKAGAVVTCLLLITSAYYGSTVTHGDGFVLQPVTASQEPIAVTFEEARVFEHVLQPILANKCLSCHNKEKHKGDLLLTDSSAMLSGGKTGKLFIAGNPGESLLVQRLLLPRDEKKHMPPTAKPQLTKQELSFIQHWIKSGADFTARLADLPEHDTLRLIATQMFESKEEGEDYTFPAVAERTIEELNSNYRVVRPVSLNSPALNVNIYDRNAYSPKTIEDLKNVRAQVVSLDVAKMPVTDLEMRHVARLENLERLNLNFTEITGKGLLELRALKNLTALSLSGTAISYNDLREFLPAIQSLEVISVWDTQLSRDDIRNLREQFRNIEFVGESSGNEPLIKLNPPRLKNRIRVFDDSISPDLFHPVNGVDIRFTLDGSDPDSVTSTLFDGKTVIRQSVQIRARAYKDGWLSSDVATLSVYASTRKPDTVILLSKLNRVHPANGAKTFFDRELGSFNANSPAWANNWAGFRGNDMQVLLRYFEPAVLKSASLNVLIETETSIFPPSEIEVWGGDSPDDLKLLTRKKIILPSVYRKPYIELITCEFPEMRLAWVKIVAKPVMKLPAWHKNKDKPALMLIDEILVN